MFARIWHWLFPCPLKQWQEEQDILAARVKRIRESFTPEQHAAAARIVAHGRAQEGRVGSSTSRSRSRSSRSSNRGGGSGGGCWGDD